MANPGAATRAGDAIDPHALMRIKSLQLRARAAVDGSCLDLCMSLLDHDLAGDLFESVFDGEHWVG